MTVPTWRPSTTIGARSPAAQSVADAGEPDDGPAVRAEHDDLVAAALRDRRAAR